MGMVMQMFGWSLGIPAMAYDGADVVAAQTNAVNVASHGLMAGTKIASNLGWRDIEALAVGDNVLTFDNAMQEIVEIRRTVMWKAPDPVPPAQWPVTVPEGALGNRCDLVLLPDQGVLVESDQAFDNHGDPFALVPAQSLEGLRGIHRSPPARQMELITLFFENDEVIYTEGGFLVHCPQAVQSLADMVTPEGAAYPLLALHEAECVVSALNIEATVAASKGAYVIGATNQVLIA